jgi:hypothetical protein
MRTLLPWAFAMFAHLAALLLQPKVLEGTECFRQRSILVRITQRHKIIESEAERKKNALFDEKKLTPLNILIFLEIIFAA